VPDAGRWPADSVVLASFGDASVNHAAAAAAFNTAGWCDHTGLRLPLLLVCEDNGLGLSVRSPRGWVAQALRARPGIRYLAADGCDLPAAYDAAVEAADWVRRNRRPAVLHLSVERLMGHAGADAELAYRTPAEIAAGIERDPIVTTARLLIAAGVATPDALLSRYDEVGWQVRRVAEEVLAEPKLTSAAEVIAPLAPRRPVRVARVIADAAARLTTADHPETATEQAPDGNDPLRALDPVGARGVGTAAAAPSARGAVGPATAPAPAAGSVAATGSGSASGSGTGSAAGRDGRPGAAAGSLAPTPERLAAFAGKPPEESGALTLAQTINATLTDSLASLPHLVVFGEDVAAKGGVYGVTKSLRERFGPVRVFDTLADETSILGLGLGAGLSGMLPVPEIQYLAYLHSAEDQLRGEAATMQFFTGGQYRNPMVVRIAGLAYQAGFGGHFHNDNAVAVLRDIPGLVVACPTRAEDAAPMLRTCIAAAEADGTVAVYLEPIALYHTRDLYADGDGGWLAPYLPPGQWANAHVPIGRARVYAHGSGDEITVVTFGNGVPMSLRVAARLAEEGVGVRVVDLRWLSPLPVADIIREASATGRVLIVDETRRSGGVGEGVLAALVDAGYVGVARRVASVDSFIPIGPAASQVLVSEEQIMVGARSLLVR
jgi:2-oxoisovalerate dehydrogenase E1 component